MIGPYKGKDEAKKTSDSKRKKYSEKHYANLEDSTGYLEKQAKIEKHDAKALKGNRCPDYRQ